MGKFLKPRGLKGELRLSIFNEVDISLTESENTNIYELRLGEGDVGKVIGKKGRNVMAIRTLLSAATAKQGGKRSMLEIIE